MSAHKYESMRHKHMVSTTNSIHTGVYGVVAVNPSHRLGKAKPHRPILSALGFDSPSSSSGPGRSSAVVITRVEDIQGMGYGEDLEGEEEPVHTTPITSPQSLMGSPAPAHKSDKCIIM